MKSSFAKTDNSVFNNFQKYVFFIVHSNYLNQTAVVVILIGLNNN